MEQAGFGVAAVPSDSLLNYDKSSVLNNEGSRKPGATTKPGALPRRRHHQPAHAEHAQRRPAADYAFGLVAMLWRTQNVDRMTLGILVMVNAFMISSHSAGFRA
jgi:hypothetical protein